jgi:hypothetical protein
MTTSNPDHKTRPHLLRLVRYAAKTAHVAESKRDSAIREAHRAGVSLRDIAVESGISHTSVKRIIDRVGPSS